MLKIVRTSPARRFLFKRSRIALTELNNVVNGSNIQWHGKSYVASVPSDAPKSQRGRKLTRDERKAMVESFVNKYRVTHDGKFPTTSDVRKNVGGSYYVLKIILQEVVHKCKSSSPDGTENLVGDRLIKEHEVCVDGGTQNEVDKVAANNVEIGDVSEKHLEAEGSPFTSSLAESNMFEEVENFTDGQPNPVAKQSNLMKENSNDVSYPQFIKPEDVKLEGAEENHLDFVAKETHPFKEETDKTFYQGQDTAENHKKEEPEGVPSYFVARESPLLKGETEEVSHPSAGNAKEKEEQVVSEVSVESGDTKHKAEQYKGSAEVETSAIYSSSRQTDDVEVPKKRTLWGNLKSFADGFFSMWRKS